jgi:two-component system, OmpR family, sensor histidine kinase KdpD
MIDNRPSPEQLLEQIEQEEEKRRRGRLKIFLGYASGAGKSAQMLDEGRRRRERGQDVVVGALQPKLSRELQSILSALEIIPTRNIGGKDVIDIEEILARRPKVVLIDGLAYDNPPGGAHEKRWQDVEELLESGISVLATINLQYIAELQDEVAAITGSRQSETVPRTFLERADEIVIADAPCPDEQLSRLRELTMLLAAEVIDRQLQNYMRSHGIAETWGTQERILACITPRSNARQILESGRRNADRFHGKLFAAYVRQPNLSEKDKMTLEQNLSIAREVGAEVEVLEGRDGVRTIFWFARKNGITQIFIGHSQRQGWWNRLRGNPVERLIGLAERVDVRVFPQGGQS